MTQLTGGLLFKTLISVTHFSILLLVKSGRIVTGPWI